MDITIKITEIENSEMYCAECNGVKGYGYSKQEAFSDFVEAYDENPDAVIPE